jgi:hypothetical protein
MAEIGLQRDETESELSRRPGNVIPVLFIAGAPRSGSTLLDRVIGMHDGFCSVGESHFIWERSFGQNHLCGCGSPFQECSFWEEVSQRAFGVKITQVDEKTAIRQKESVDRKRHLPWLILSHRPARYQSALLTYGETLERLYGAILRTSGERVVVDSSKDPKHGLILSRLPGFQLHVVHLVRDSRAVAFSWRRSRRRPEIHWKAEDMPIERVTSTATRWTIHNALVESLSASAASYCRIRYEDFVEDPNVALSRIMAPYEWMQPKMLGAENAAVALEPTHTVSGNPMRFEHGQVNIKLDNEWRHAMNLRDRSSVTAVTWPLLARYGYPLRSSS